MSGEGPKSGSKTRARRADPLKWGGVDPACKEKSAEEHFSKSTAAEKVMLVSRSGLGAVWVAPGPLSEPS